MKNTEDMFFFEEHDLLHCQALYLVIIEHYIYFYWRWGGGVFVELKLLNPRIAVNQSRMWDARVFHLASLLDH